MDGWMEVLALHYILHIAWPHLFLVVTLASTSYDMLTIYKASYHKSEVRLEFVKVAARQYMVDAKTPCGHFRKRLSLLSTAYCASSLPQQVNTSNIHKKLKFYVSFY